MSIFSRPSVWFALFAVGGFGLQGVVSNTGALSVLFPDLPFPIPFINGRTFHVNISLYWIFAGILGGALFFLRPAGRQGLLQDRLAGGVFCLMAIVAVGLEGSLVLRYPVGREFLEGPWLFRGGLPVVPFMSAILLLRFCLINGPGKGWTIALGSAVGFIVVFAACAAAAVYYTNPALSAAPRFLAFHLILGAGAELIGISLTALLFTKICRQPGGTAEMLAGLGSGLAVISGGLGLLQYWLWPGDWLAIAAAAGMFLLLYCFPSGIILYLAVRYWRSEDRKSMQPKDEICFVLLTGSQVFHWLGAGVGFMLAFPPVSQYIHGTYIASAHSHWALFGAYGLLALALASHILFEQLELTAKRVRLFLRGVALVYAGMLGMGISLLLTGGLQTYLLRILQAGIPVSDALLRPYLFVRIGGGMTYMLGSLLCTYVVFRQAWQQRELLLHGKPKVDWLPVQDAQLALLQKQKNAQHLLERIQMLRELLTKLSVMRKKY